MTLDAWLSAHPFLRPIADVHAQIDRAAADCILVTAAVPDWTTYADDYFAGVPLLRSAAAAVDLTPAEVSVRTLVSRLTSVPLPRELATQCQALDERFRRSPATADLEGAALVDLSTLAPNEPGLLRYLGWTVLARYLAPTVESFAAWRDEERWLRSYCPTCGAMPAMGHLVGVDPGRLRFLSCGGCKTRWRYRRTGCPFCDGQRDHRLSVVAIEGESGLRIDYCETCSGYLKTYTGQGSEQLLLADWTSLHLDVLAADRGLKRLAASLFEL